jgi:hypothetical protein
VLLLVAPSGFLATMPVTVWDEGDRVVGKLNQQPRSRVEQIQFGRVVIPNLTLPGNPGSNLIVVTEIEIQLGMRESGYSLSPLYLKPVLIVGKFVRVCVRPSVSRQYLDLDKFSTYITLNFSIFT